MIKQFINSITVSEADNYYTGKTTKEYKFFGDGTGDFEQLENDATEETLENYITYCENQIRLARECLQIKQSRY